MTSETQYVSNAVRAGDRHVEETPADAYGPDYLIRRIREDFHDLCRFMGRGEARQEIAEIVNAEFSGRTIEHA